MLRFSVFLFLAVLMPSTGNIQTCLRGAGHKPRPTRERYLKECTIYAKSACCSADITKELAHSPVVKIDTTFWNRCGNLSSVCEAYMKKIECFYRCSPYAVKWAHPKHAAAISSVPICKKFCDDWYEACESDQTCVSNWLTDWEIDEKGENHCKNECIPISEMYANGTDMCEKMWGDSLKVSHSSCLCLNMDETDPKAIMLIRGRVLGSSSSSSSSLTRSINEDDVERFCQFRLKKERELRNRIMAWQNTVVNIPVWCRLCSFILRGA
ncbi:riboflavin-binding protein-like [Protobothrops mucrosquamatus]|uniref:riboflavin-binding protein-like n=1 Tax=Protobothrops mucrosquamatus TaxID=103944 RepID=UPI000775892D|nr:riboflavin-binding protein-like [Protobothrops mucrosquamatus]